jgi:hypothetical protein
VADWRLGSQPDAAAMRTHKSEVDEMVESGARRFSKAAQGGRGLGAPLCIAALVMMSLACDDGKRDDAPDQSQSTPDLSQSADLAADPVDLDGPCEQVQTYVDRDGDGWGVESELGSVLCLRAGEAAPEGFARRAGDCDDEDPLKHPEAEGICGDHVDDTCDGSDEVCPMSMPGAAQLPAWDCVSGAPPSNVVAWARFEDGGTFFKPNGCFVFFEGARDRFFVTRVNLEGAKDDCTHRDGCVCPSLGGWPSYDRRLYAVTLDGPAAECDEIALVDHAGEEQPVSNRCRKYLYQLHRYEIPYSYLSSDLDTLMTRLNRWASVEIACFRDAPHRNLPFASLLTAPIQLNDGFIKAR